MDAKLLKEKLRIASEKNIQKAAGKLPLQWNMGESKHCLHRDWPSLAAAVGLSMSDIPALQSWVASRGLKPPSKEWVRKVN